MPGTFGAAGDMVIYEDQYYGGQFEVIAQKLNAFNAASGGALLLTAESIIGHHQKESFIKQVANLITRRDITSLAAAADMKLQMDEFINVKINRKIGPIAQTIDAWKKLGKTPQEFSFVLGKMVAEAKMQDQVNTTIAALSSALANVDEVYYDGTSGTMTHGTLVKGMAKRGDAAGDLICWVMHSKPYFDLVGQALVDKLFEVAGAVVYSGTVATLGKPTIVIDVPGLFIDGGAGDDKYTTLGLCSGAAATKESEADTVVMQTVTGNEQLFQRLQGEFTYNLGLKGFKWDIAAGGTNPTDGALFTGSNWDKAINSHKHLGGIAIQTL